MKSQKMLKQLYDQAFIMTQLHGEEFSYTAFLCLNNCHKINLQFISKAAYKQVSVLSHPSL